MINESWKLYYTMLVYTYFYLTKSKLLHKQNIILVLYCIIDFHNFIILHKASSFCSESKYVQVPSIILCIKQYDVLLLLNLHYQFILLFYYFECH